jgi:hypothetical protein
MLACADEDRCFMPFAVSIRSMVDKIRSVLEEIHAHVSLGSVGIKIPSHNYAQMQFAPKDKCTSKALAYRDDCLSILNVVRTFLMLFLWFLLLFLLLLLLLLLLRLLLLLLLLLLMRLMLIVACDVAFDDDLIWLEL